MTESISKASDTMKNTPFTSAIIVAAGNASRMGMDVPKQLLTLGGKTVIEHTLSVFERCPLISQMIVVTRSEDVEKVSKITEGFSKLTAVVPGGKERIDSVYAGVRCADPSARFFAIHDGARMLITEEEITRVLTLAYETRAATLGTPVTDTVKLTDGGVILSTPDRSSLYAVQTPQVFEKSLYLRAMENARCKRLSVTDDCSLVEALGEKVHIARGEYTNIKLTTKTDLIFVRAILAERGNTR